MVTGITLSQLLQHPTLANASPFQPKRQQQQQQHHPQQQQQQGGPGPGQAFAQQMLGLYNAEQQHQQAQGAPAEPVWQPSAASLSTSTLPGDIQEGYQPTRPGQTRSSPVSGSSSFTQGPFQQPPLVRDSSPEAMSCGSPSYSFVRAAAAKAANQQLPSQSSPAVGGRNKFLQTSMSPEAGQLLAGSVSSWYDGGGPLTAGVKQQWNLSRGPGVPHGRGLEQVRLCMYRLTLDSNEDAMCCLLRVDPCAQLLVAPLQHQQQWRCMHKEKHTNVSAFLFLHHQTAHALL